MITSRSPYATLFYVVINRAKFDVCTSSSFGEVKTHVRTDRIVFCMSGTQKDTKSAKNNLIIVSAVDRGKALNAPDNERKRKKVS